MSKKKEVKKVEKVEVVKIVKIVKQESVEVNGEMKIKYTLSDDSVQIKGL